MSVQHEHSFLSYIRFIPYPNTGIRTSCSFAPADNAACADADGRRLVQNDDKNEPANEYLYDTANDDAYRYDDASRYDEAKLVSIR